MTRDTVKTLAGLLVIGVIVIATFMYGNAQRQAQLRSQESKNQQVAQSGSTLQKASPSSTATASPKSQANTAPVQSPTGNSLQGGSTASPKPSASASPTPSKSPTPSSSPGQVAGAQTVPVTGGTGSSLPQAGSPLEGLVGIIAVIAGIVAVRWSGHSIKTALRRSGR